MKARSLDAIFRPRAVAVVGASRRPASIGRELIKNLIEFEYAGKVFPVNPRAHVVHSMKCYRRLSDIPDEVDLAVIVVPRELVPGIVRECARKRIKGIVTITAGFREVGPAGAALEAEIAKTLRRHGMRMVGPNCMGVINTHPEVRLNATFAGARPERGGAAFVSQSGALGEAILANAKSLGLGISMFASMGNKTDVSGNDLLEYWEDDPDVRLILMYLESFGNPTKFIRLARRISRAKPILTVKSGRTEAGARAASSHTGSIVGRDIAVASLLDQSGVLRVSTMEELFTLATAFSLQPVPKGNRVGIVTNAGGPGILATDACIAQGLALPELSARTRARVTKLLPPEATFGNPIDLIASATPERFEAAIRAVVADPNVDSVVAIFVSPVIVDPRDMARAIVRGAKGARKTVVSCFMGKEGSEGAEDLRAGGIPAYRFPETAAIALGAMNRYRILRDRPVGRIVPFEIDVAKVRGALAQARGGGAKPRGARQARGRLGAKRRARGAGVAEGWLPGKAVEELLVAAGLPVAASRRVRTAEEAIRAAHEIGYPVVLKAESERLLHKTDVGGVKIDIRNADELVAAFEEIARTLGAHVHPAPERAQRSRGDRAGARRRTVAEAGGVADRRIPMKVQAMVKGGREVILGVTRDPQYGHLLLFGLGGIHVEVLRDVAVRVHPITDVEAREMIASIRGYPLLAGSRGERPADLSFVEEALLRLSGLVSKFPEIEEMDINPLIVADRPGRSFVVDARVKVAARLRPRMVG